MGTISPLVALCKDHSKELEARRYATLALANLAATVANHPAIIEEGAMQALFALSNTSDTMSQYYVAYALANLASNERMHLQMVEEFHIQHPLQL